MGRFESRVRGGVLGVGYLFFFLVMDGRFIIVLVAIFIFRERGRIILALFVVRGSYED